MSKYLLCQIIAFIFIPFVIIVVMTATPFNPYITAIPLTIVLGYTFYRLINVGPDIDCREVSLEELKEFQKKLQKK